MKKKIYDFINVQKNPIGEVVIQGKEIIETKAIDSNYRCNGQDLNSTYRTNYKLFIYDKYDGADRKGKIAIHYEIRKGTVSTFYIKPNFFEKIYLKFLCKYFI